MTSVLIFNNIISKIAVNTLGSREEEASKHEERRELSRRVSEEEKAMSSRVSSRHA